MAEKNGGGESLPSVAGECVAKFDRHEGVEAEVAERLVEFEAAGDREPEDAQSKGVDVLAEEFETAGGGSKGDFFEKSVSVFAQVHGRGSSGGLERARQRGVEVRQISFGVAVEEFDPVDGGSRNLRWRFQKD